MKARRIESTMPKSEGSHDVADTGWYLHDLESKAKQASEKSFRGSWIYGCSQESSRPSLASSGESAAVVESPGEFLQ